MVVVFRLALCLVVESLARLVNSIKGLVVMGVARLVIGARHNRDWPRVGTFPTQQLRTSPGQEWWENNNMGRVFRG